MLYCLLHCSTQHHTHHVVHHLPPTYSKQHADPYWVHWLDQVAIAVVFLFRLVSNIRLSFNLLDSLLKRCVSFVYIHNFLKGHMKTRKSLVVQSSNSQVFTHPIINMAQFCLTSGIRRELLFSTRYGLRCYNKAMPSLHQKSDIADKE